MGLDCCDSVDVGQDCCGPVISDRSYAMLMIAEMMCVILVIPDLMFLLILLSLHGICVIPLISDKRLAAVVILDRIWNDCNDSGEHS